MSEDQLGEVKIILTDIDDTLTTNGKLKSSAYSALERLSDAGYIVIPVTGRCAGWCDHIARMWPVNGVIGENGAFFFSYDHESKKIKSEYCQTEKERKTNHSSLSNIRKLILDGVPGSALASDQDYRHTDLAIDFAEDVSPLSSIEISKIVGIAESGGAIAKVSSIHVNCWIGSHNKLSTSLMILEKEFRVNLVEMQKEVIFIGDSPNDSLMFGYFDKSVGVANVIDFIDDLDQPPKYTCKGHSGDGFVELADFLLNN